MSDIGSVKHFPLGSRRTVEEVHEEAIRLWIYAKEKNPEANPAAGIYFALTNQAWPPTQRKVANVIDLCGVLNGVMALPQLTSEQRYALNLKAMALLEEHESGRSPMRLSRYLVWANRFGYLLGGASLLFGGFSWWVAGLMVAVWSCHGAARTAVEMAQREERPKWEAPVIASMHITALGTLVVVSIFNILGR